MLRSTSTEQLQEFIRVVNIEASRRRLENFIEDIEMELTDGDLCEEPDGAAHKIMEALCAWLYAVDEEHEQKNPNLSWDEMHEMLGKMSRNLDKFKREYSR